MKSEVTHTPTVVVSPSASVKQSVDCMCSVETEGRIKCQVIGTPDSQSSVSCVAEHK